MPALVVYDYLLTLHQEIVLVWKQRITPTSILLLSTRAASLLYVILAFTPMTESTKVCREIPSTRSHVSDSSPHLEVRYQLACSFYRANCSSSCMTKQILEDVLDIVIDAQIAREPCNPSTTESNALTWISIYRPAYVCHLPQLEVQVHSVRGDLHAGTYAACYRYRASHTSLSVLITEEDCQVLAASLRTMQIYPPFRGPPVCGSIIQLPTRVKPS